MVSREVQRIIDYAEATGLPYRVTATVGRYISPANPCDPHTAGSLHCAEGTGGAGRAVDFSGAVPGAGPAAVQQMKALWDAFYPATHQLAELFFNGPGITMVVKNGVWRPGLDTLGPTQWAAHRDHVHVAVAQGVFLTPPAPPPRPTPPPLAGPVYDFEEATIKSTLVHIGPLDQNGSGWSDWQCGLGRDPIVVGLVQLGPSPPDDQPPYWPAQAKVNLSAQPRGGVLRVVVRNGTPGDTVSAWATIA